MNAILPVILVLCGFSNAPVDGGGSVEDQPAPLVAVACGDWIDLALLVEDEGVETVVLSTSQLGEVLVVTALHVADGGESACSWVGYYAFPSSIEAHSVVTVPFHAEEME